jgi:hypothetical protein
MLHGVKPWALGEHPTREDPLFVAGERDLVHLNEGGRMRCLGGGTRIADPGRHFQRAELHGLIDRNFQMRNTAGHLVEGGEHGDGVLDGIGLTGPR